MLKSFNNHQDYFNYCCVYILNIIVHYPQFNNYENICEIYDIYIRKIVSNSSYSSQIKTDCSMMVKFFYTDDYINNIISSFEKEEDAYHYLAILVQFQRISNRYKMSSLSPYHYYNPSNMYNAIIKLGF